MYEDIGGQETIEKLVDDFYYIMSTDPKAQDCLATHRGRDLQESAHKLKYFLSGWLGGPALYHQTYGHPRLRMRHAPFSIGDEESDQWLYCMHRALEQSTIPQEFQVQLLKAFAEVTGMLRNRD